MSEKFNSGNKLRMLIAPSRSGSSALINALSQSDEVFRCFFQTIKAGIRAEDKPDYGVFSSASEEGVVIAKETFGFDREIECDFDLFPSREDMINTVPSFLFREPLETYASWKRLGGDDLDLFILSYQSAFKTYQQAREICDQVGVVLYKDFKDSPEATFKTLCETWGLKFQEKMLNWEVPLKNNPKMVIGDHIKAQIESNSAVYEGASQAGFRHQVTPANITEAESAMIEAQLGAIYRKLESL